MGSAKIKCNKKFVKVDSLNLKFISKLSASLYYLLPVNFCSEMFFFSNEGNPARTLQEGPQ